MGIIKYDLKDDESTQDEHYKRSGSRVYQVMATTDLDSNGVRTAFPGVIGSAHPTDIGQLLKSKSARLTRPTKGTYYNNANPADAHNNTDCYVWDLTLSYGPWDPLQHTSDGNPLNQPPVVRFSGQTFQEIADKDRDGNPIVNSAGDYFDPPVMRDRTRPVITITVNMTEFSDSTILAYADKTNSDTFYSYAPDTLKCSAPTAEPLYSQEVDLNYYRVTFELHYNPDTWTVYLLNQGYRKLVTAGDVSTETTTQAPILISGLPATSPVLLKSNGEPLLPPVNAADIVILGFPVYDQLEFTAAFSLPSGLLN